MSSAVTVSRDDVAVGVMNDEGAVVISVEVYAQALFVPFLLGIP